MTSSLERLYYLSVELHPALPSQKMMALLGKSWQAIITAGAQFGLAGSAAALPKVSYEQLSSLYMSGAESGSEPSLDEFRSAIAAHIYENVCGNEKISTLDQIRLAGELGRWFEGGNAMVDDGEMDMDAEVSTPPFTSSGFWPLDRLFGGALPQGIVTLLARPEAGKSTICMSIAAEWKRAKIGPVVFVQTEMAPSAMRLRLDSIAKPSEQLWVKGEDRMFFGRRGADSAIESLIKNPDPDRLVIFDSIIGYAGSGDTSDSRAKYWSLFADLCTVKNASRIVIAATHVKRGVDMADIESAAGSSSIERFSDCLAYIDKDSTPRPDGFQAIKIEALKSRFKQPTRPIHFTMDFASGKAYENDPLDDMISEVIE